MVGVPWGSQRVGLRDHPAVRSTEEPDAPLVTEDRELDRTLASVCRGVDGGMRCQGQTR